MRSAILWIPLVLATSIAFTACDDGDGGQGSVPLPDVSPPSTPTGFAATATGLQQATLTWQPATDTGTGVAGYNIYRDGTRIASTDLTTHEDAELQPGNRYSYAVTAYDAGSPANESAPSAPVAVEMTLVSEYLCPVDAMGDTFGRVEVGELNNRGDLLAVLEGLSVSQGRERGVFLLSDGQYSDICLLDQRTARSCYAVTMNETGQVIGETPYGSAFYYHEGAMTVLDPIDGHDSVRLWDLNDAGQIVGSLMGATGDRAFLYADGTMTFIDVPSAGSLSINQAGVVAGTYRTEIGEPPGQQHHVMVYAEGSLDDLGDCWYSYAERDTSDLWSPMVTMIDSRNRVVCGETGRSGSFWPDIPGGPIEFFQITIQVTYLLSPEPTLLFEGLPVDLNDRGQVLAWDTSDRDPVGDGAELHRAFVWSDGTQTDLRSFNGCKTYGASINNHGEVVGYTWRRTETGCSIYPTVATLFIGQAAWDLNELIDPNDPIKGVVDLTGAGTVNDRGQILAYTDSPPDPRCYGYLLSLKGARATN